ncbi:MAG: ATP-binding protein [Burkholderiaceae bacterium]|jgi:two-component sensor histidine kinase/CheY-like chemotaxis protein|nr:ATP-binding protein [Burkholderiaceae bacterium]
MTSSKAGRGSAPEAERSSAAERASSAERRRAIVADIRHDLKNARLASAAALHQLAALAQDEPLRAAVAGAGAAVGELAQHAERGLELLSLGIDDVEPLLEPTALEPMLREVDLAREGAARLAGMRLRTVPTGAVAAVDARLLMRGVGNLVTNAIEHSGASRILVGVRRRGEGCVIEVRDNGRGIDPRAVPAAQTRHWAEGCGRGLGLWIAARLAELQGGALEIRTEPGRGSCLRITLPGPVCWAPGSARSARSGRARFDRRVVVLRDDDARRLRATALAFERRGATVVAARSRVEFWSEIEQLPHPPDLCVLDLGCGCTQREPTDPAESTGASDLAWLGKRFGNRTRAVVLTASAADPTPATIGGTPVFAKPLTDDAIDAIGALLTASSGS